MNGLSKTDLAALLEIIHDCVHCTSRTEFVRIAKKLGVLLEAENLVFLSSELEFASHPAAIHEINVSYPREWTDIYREQQFVRIDPIFNAGRTGLIYWRDLYHEFPPDREFLGQAESFGLCNGFSHILADRSSFGLMSVADPGLRDCERTRTILDTVAPHFHQLSVRMLHRMKREQLPHLTPRERDVLLWAMEGKSNWEISVILGIGRESVKGHMANILHKLDAANRAQAVAIALQYDLLLPE